MDIKYTNIFNSNVFQNTPKLGFLVYVQIYRLAILLRSSLQQLCRETELQDSAQKLVTNCDYYYGVRSDNAEYIHTCLC
jgi:hypothetical protein